MLQIVLKIVIALVIVVAAMYGVGLAMPRAHRASSRITLAKPPAAVWPVVRDLASLQGTWKELESARRLPDEGGKEVWEQKAGGFAMRMFVEESVEPIRLVTRIDADQKAVFGGTWTYELVPSGGGTQLTVTENGYVTNPLLRVLMRAMGVHKTLDAYESALGRKLGETVKPEHVTHTEPSM